MTALAGLALVATCAAAMLDAPLHLLATQSQLWVFQFLRTVTDAAKSQWYLVPAALLVLVIGCMNWALLDRRLRATLARHYADAAFVFVSIAGAGIAVNIVKQIVGRARPWSFAETGPFAFHPLQFDHAFQSFPSGHSTDAGAIAMVLMLFFPRWRVAAFGLLFLLAFARVPAGAHYPSDVVAGFACGLLFTLWLARLAANRRVALRPQPPSLLPAVIGISR